MIEIEQDYMHPRTVYDICDARERRGEIIIHMGIDDDYEPYEAPRSEADYWAEIFCHGE
jgi:hypothetical protein